MWYIIYNGKYSAIKKEQNSAICSYLDATGNVAKKKKKPQNRFYWDIIHLPNNLPI